MLTHRGEIDGQAFTLRGVSRRQMASISKHGKLPGPNWGLAFRPNTSGETWDLAVRVVNIEASGGWHVQNLRIVDGRVW